MPPSSSASVVGVLVTAVVTASSSEVAGGDADAACEAIPTVSPTKVDTLTSVTYWRAFAAG
jgi:hypothetical protein